MNRFIDPQIFGTPRPEASLETAGNMNLDSIQGASFSQQSLVAGEVARLEHKIEKIRGELDNWLKSTNMRVEKNTTKSTVTEQRLDQALKEIKEKMIFLSEKVKDKLSADSKIEVMIARHNQILQNYEAKLNQSARTIEDQGAMIQRLSRELVETKSYIEKLKRMT